VDLEDSGLVTAERIMRSALNNFMEATVRGIFGRGR
jgi:hypothetical protein